MNETKQMAEEKISVIIASGAGGDFLFRCLESLKKQISDQDAEVIVVDRCGKQTVARIEKEHPFVKVIEARLGNRPSVPELRMLGVIQAQGDIIAVIEEHCVAPHDWIEVILNSFQNGDAAIGGPILDNNFDRIRDWVVYFTEYHNYLPPWAEGERYMLNGANIAYNRESLLKHKDILDSGYWEIVLHPQLAKEGLFRAVQDMGVYHTGPFDYRYYLGQRYLLSRVWGGTQKESVSFAKRLVYLLAAPVFPFLLLGRIANRVFMSRQRVGQFLLAIPLLVPVVVAYVFGEWLGYLVGVGDALERVE